MKVIALIVALVGWVGSVAGDGTSDADEGFCLLLRLASTRIIKRPKPMARQLRALGLMGSIGFNAT
jgi:hypothetical protein